MATAERVLIPDFTLEKIIHKSQSNTAVQSNFSMGLVCSASSGFAFLNLKRERKKQAKPNQKDNNAKQKKSLWR